MGNTELVHYYYQHYSFSAQCYTQFFTYWLLRIRRKQLWFFYLKEVKNFKLHPSHLHHSL